MAHRETLYRTLTPTKNKQTTKKKTRVEADLYILGHSCQFLKFFTSVYVTRMSVFLCVYTHVRKTLSFLGKQSKLFLPWF